MKEKYFVKEAPIYYKGLEGSIGIKRKKNTFIFGTKNDKFPFDKVNVDDKNYLMHLDGVILNADELLNEYNSKNISKLLIKLWKKYKYNVARYLKGSFALVIFDKKTNDFLISNDLLGKRDLYYYLTDNVVLYSESFNNLVRTIKDKRIKTTLDAKSCSEMCSYGHIKNNRTYIKEVSYLGPFEYIKNSGKRVVLCKYDLENKYNYDNLEDSIQTFDTLFNRAVDRSYKKNVVNKYKNISSISGGMDSRSTILTAKRNGYINDYCFCYSQSSSTDYKVAKEICNDLNTDLMFLNLDNGKCIKQIFDAMALNENQLSGFGTTGATFISKNLNLSNCGIIHSGLFGGELLGSLVKYKGSKFDYWSSVFGIKEWNEDRIINDFDELLLNIRICCNFTHMFYHECEVSSPFLDEDLVLFAINIPKKYLIRRTFYRKWMAKYIPNDYYTPFYKGKLSITPLKELAISIKNKLTPRYFLLKKMKYEMNPLDYWLNNNKELNNYLLDAYMSLVNKLKNYSIPYEVIYCIEKEFSNESHRCNVLTCLNGLNNLYENK